MMLAIFAFLTIAFFLDFLDRRRSALICLAASLGLTLGLFAWEIYSPDYGFRMPWLQVELEQRPPPREALDR
jgi:hypothetical protein